MTKSHSTPRLLLAVMLAAIAVGAPLIAQRVAEPELLLREALHKQQVQGDLPGAIKIYQQLVSTRNGNRAVTARALLELAGCYEKLGQQADAVYQQIVRDFSDQPAAVQARARLAALRPPAPAPTMTLRKLEIADDVVRIFATDGQHALFVDSLGQERTVFFAHLSGKEKRAVARVGPGRLAATRDLSLMAAYQSQTQKISIIRTDGSGERVLALTENGHPATMPWPGPLLMTWSWDNRYLLIISPDEAGARLLRITVADGTVTDILPGRQGVTNAGFSPDGQFVAYRQGGIYVVPASGGESHLIATNVALVDWTRDGRHVLISERAADGQQMLSAVPVQNGRKQGERSPVRPIPALSARTMLNGALRVGLDESPLGRDTWVGILDDGNASITWTAMNLVGPPLAGAFAAWSPEATRFAYVTGDPRQIARVVRVKNIATDEDRELYRADRIIGCVAAHHEDLLFCARIVDGRTEVVSVSLDSGRTETRGTLSHQDIVVQMTIDDRKILFYKGQTNAHVEWEIATGEERAVPFYRSADARWHLKESMDSAAGNVALRIRSAAGGDDWRFLVARRVPPPEYAAPPWRFTPDGNRVVYHDRDTAGKDGLYRIATGGGEPQRLGDYPTDRPTSVISIDRDGRRFIVHAPQVRETRRFRDLWVLENFLPAEKPSATTAKKNGK